MYAREVNILQYLFIVGVQLGRVSNIYHHASHHSKVQGERTQFTICSDSGYWDKQGVSEPTFQIRDGQLGHDDTFLHP